MTKFGICGKINCHLIGNIFYLINFIPATGDHRLKLDIALSSNTIPEDAQNGTKVGTLSMLHGKPGATYRLRIMNREEVPFRLAGNDLILVTGVPLDYETTNSTGVGIIAVDSSGNTVQRMFLIKITSNDIFVFLLYSNFKSSNYWFHFCS